MIGKRISHYEIVGKIGAGGMGVVYKARDTRLDRFVALKFLPHHLSDQEEEKQRFVHEAKAASTLQHNNICTIHEIDETEDGQLFICMDYYEGELLKDKVEGEGGKSLPVEEAVELIQQIARGLAKAHEQQIVHRDLKPANVVITGDGVAKILDFGLAKLGGQTKLTKAGTTLGTAAYMSPEQARGEDVDHRTDIFSLGALFYQILAGSLPFKGDYEQAVVYAILNEEPEPLTNLRPDVPAELEQVVQKAMHKNPEERYGQVGDFLADLEALQKPSAAVTPSSDNRRPSRGVVYSVIAAALLLVALAAYVLRPVADQTSDAKSIAVLPFQDISPNKDQEYFCDGMAEELINALTKLPGLRVAARTSTFYFKGREESIESIGEQLNVSSVLSGSVRKAGNKLRITAQLVNVSDGFHLWSETYEKELADVFAIQEDISRQIIFALETELALATGEQIVNQYTDNEEAYNLYLQGRYFWNRRSPDALIRSIDLFNQAIALDPAFARAYAGLADAYNQMGDYVVKPSEAYPKAKAAGEKAIAIDPNLADAHCSIAYVDYNYDWNWAAAEAGFRRAIALNPNYPTAHQWYAEFLASQGRFDEAKTEIRRALDLDPLSLIINVVDGAIDYWRRDFDAALAQLKKTAEMDTTFAVTYVYLNSVYVAKNMVQESYRTERRLAELTGLPAEARKQMDAAFAASGLEGLYEFIVHGFEDLTKERYVNPFVIAIYNIRLNRMSEALDWIETGVKERSFGITSLPNWPAFDPLRSEPRFQQALDKMEQMARAAAK